MGSGIFDRIKGLFYEAKDEQPKKEPVKEEKIPSKPQQPIQTTPKATLKGPAVSSDGKEANDIYEGLMSSVLEGQTLYTQFRKVTNSIFETIKDETAGYKAAFAAISGITNATANELLGSIDSCINRLANEEQEFKAQAATHRQKVDDLKQQLENLNRQIMKLEEKRKELNKEILDEGSKIEKIETYFRIAKEKVENELNQEKSKIERFLNVSNR